MQKSLDLDIMSSIKPSYFFFEHHHPFKMADRPQAPSTPPNQRMRSNIDGLEDNPITPWAPVRGSEKEVRFQTRASQQAKNYRPKQSITRRAQTGRIEKSQPTPKRSTMASTKRQEALQVHLKDELRPPTKTATPTAFPTTYSSMARERTECSELKIYTTIFSIRPKFAISSFGNITKPNVDGPPTVRKSPATRQNDRGGHNDFSKASSAPGGA
jgi:hypothetical protein